MARFARVIALGVPHHITQRGNARRFILDSDAQRICQLPGWQESVVVSEWRQDGSKLAPLPGPMAPPLEPLADIYQNSPLFLSLRDSSQLKGKCGRCEFREVCGGSRARAFALTGDPLAEEPCCTYIP